MITKYVEQALTRARYEPTDAEGFCATVPGLRGVIAIERTLAECRSNLTEIVEEWVLVRVARGLTIPKLGGISIRIKRAS